MKYDAHRKGKRNRLLIALYKSQRDMSLRDIGEFFNISHQRVAELVKIEEKKLGQKIVRVRGNR